MNWPWLNDRERTHTVFDRTEVLSCRKFRDLLGWSCFIEKQNKTCGLVIVKPVWGISRGLDMYLWFFCSSDSPCIVLRALMVGIMIWVPGPGYCCLACLGLDPSQSHRALSLPQPLLDFHPARGVFVLVCFHHLISLLKLFCWSVNSTCFTQ